MGATNYKQATYFAKEIMHESCYGNTSEPSLVNAFNKEINNDLDAYLTHLIEVDHQTLYTDEDGRLNLCVFEIHDGNVFIGETNLGKFNTKN